MPNTKMSEEQAKVVAEAQAAFAEFKSHNLHLDDDGIELIFNSARSLNGWQQRSVSDELLERVYNIARMGATAMNGCPARFVFIRTPEGKEKIKPTLMPINVDKVMTAPVVAIIGHDEKFYEQLDQLFPHGATEGKELFRGLPEELVRNIAFRNGTLQGAYLMIAARACGLDCGPMSGFDNAALDEAFFAHTDIRSNFICGLGYGKPESIFQRLPRLSFEQACRLV